MSASSTLARYQGGTWGASLRQLAGTAALYGGAWYLAYRSLEVSYGLTLAAGVPAAALLVRLFIIQHDCGHGSFFPRAWANNAVGRVLGVVTLTPYRYWRRFHGLHHATSGNLDRRGGYDVATLTVREYQALPAWRRLAYRGYRHPLFLLGLAPGILFLLVYRLPFIAPREWRAERRSIVATDAAIAAVVIAAGAVVGPERLLVVHLPIAWIAASMGMWLFYVQHQFEDTYWALKGEWRFDAAGMVGSSYYELPGFLRWLTGNIGFHHIHHLNPRVPNYRLHRCFVENPPLQRVTRLTVRESLRCVRFKLWDEERRRLVTFQEAFAREAV